MPNIGNRGWRQLPGFKPVCAIVAFHITVHFSLSRVILTITPTPGFYTFLAACLASMVLGHVLLGWHEMSHARCTGTAHAVRFLRAAAAPRAPAPADATPAQLVRRPTEVFQTVLEAVVGSLARSEP